MKVYTIRDIARLAGVSVTTVSRVLNHRPDVNEVTRKRVETVIAETHFVGNASARSLKQQDSEVVPLILRGRQNPFLNALSEAILLEAATKGITCLPEFIDESADEFLTALRLSHEKRVAGLIFCGGLIDQRAEVLRHVDVPMVFVTTDTTGTQLERASSVTVDDRAMGYEVIKALLSHGHQRIAIFGGNPASGDMFAQRYLGALDAFREAGCKFDESRYVITRFSLEDAVTITKAHFAAHPDTTAVFCMTDTVALGVIRGLADLGRRVPQDVSVCGFDGIEIGKYACPRLSTVEQPIEDLARESIAALTQQMLEPSLPRHITLTAALCMRESVQ